MFPTSPSAWIAAAPAGLRLRLGCRRALVASRFSSQCAVRRRRARCTVALAQGDDDVGAEDGVTLPPLGSRTIDEEKAWLAAEISEWLDKEWLPQEVHRRIGQRAAEIYIRARLEGEDLGGVVIEVGTQLESFDFEDAFIGAFDIANKVSELVMLSMGREVCCTEASDEEKRQFNLDHPIDKQSATATSSDSAGQQPAPIFPSLATGFDKYSFLQKAIDGRASSESVNAALALVLGYELDEATMQWRSDNVEDQFFTKNFSAHPPAIVGATPDENAIEHMKAVLAREKSDLLVGLDDFIETLYGEEMTKISKEEEDQEFLSRELATKWLHYFGGKAGIF